MRGKTGRVLVLGLLMCGLSTLTANAWLAIGHYLSALDAVEGLSDVPPGVEKYANLPDYHDNKEILLLTEEFFSIANTRQFCWSHGVKSYSTSANIFLFYGNDDRMPQDVMADLMVSKIHSNRFGNSSLMLAAKNTINGFIAHNEADRIVHFDYFLVGSKPNWIERHGFKEAYAEYLFVKNFGFDNNDLIMFNELGEIAFSDIPSSSKFKIHMPDTNLGIPFLTGVTADTKMSAQLMCLAQQSFAKNRPIWRDTGVSAPLDFVADDVATTIACLNKASTDLGLKAGKTYWARPWWAVWRPRTESGASIPFYDSLADSHTFTNGWDNGAPIIQNTPIKEPSTLAGEYNQLCLWYDWSRCTHTSGAATYWDNDDMLDKYRQSKDAIRLALMKNADLEPQTP